MDVESFRTAVQMAGFGALAAAFVAGFLFSFNPVALAAIPVSLAYVTRARSARSAAFLGGMFILGMVATHAALGLVAGLGGAGIQHLIGRQWGLFLGPLLILLGLVWAGWLRLPIPRFGARGFSVSGPWGAFALGVPFAIAVCPVCTPVLVVLLGVSAGIGSPLFALALLTAFALGRALPIAVGATALGYLEALRPVAKAQKALAIAGGLVLILSGLYMLNAYLFVIPELAA